MERRRMQARIFQLTSFFLFFFFLKKPPCIVVLFMYQRGLAGLPDILDSYTQLPLL